MRTKVETADINSFQNGKDQTYIWSDSPVCHYCARCNFMDPEFDVDKCESCHAHSNFLGVEALTWRTTE